MISEMRRKDRQLTTSEAEKILRENNYGVLSTVCDDGYPYGLPLSYVYDDGKLYLHRSIHSGLMGANVSSCEKACFTVVGKTELQADKFSTKYESVIIFGKIKECNDKTGVLLKLVSGLSADYIEKGKKLIASSAKDTSVYVMEPEQITAKAKAN